MDCASKGLVFVAIPLLRSTVSSCNRSQAAAARRLGLCRGPGVQDPCRTRFGRASHHFAPLFPGRCLVLKQTPVKTNTPVTLETSGSGKAFVYERAKAFVPGARGRWLSGLAPGAQALDLRWRAAAVRARPAPPRRRAVPCIYLGRMSACMCIIYGRVCVRAYVCTCVCVYACMCVCVHACMRVCVHACMLFVYACMRVHACMHIHDIVCACSCVHVYMYVYMYVYVDVYLCSLFVCLSMRVLTGRT